MNDTPPPVVRSAQPLAFHGRLAESLRIAAVNAVLQIATLGIYRFWARTRYRRFVWRETRFLDESLEYTGRGIHLFVGFVLALLVVVPTFTGLDFLKTWLGEAAPVLDSAIALLFFVLLQYGLYRARGYRLGHTLWRGIRFGQTGSGWRYALHSLGYVFVCGVALWIPKPWMDARLYALRVGNTWFGDRRVEVQPTTSGLWRPWLAVYAPLVVFGLATVALADDEDAPWAVAALFGMLLASAVAYGFYRIAQVRVFAASTRFSGAWFDSTLRVRDLVGPVVVYAVALALIGALVLAGLAAVWYRHMEEQWLHDPGTLELVLTGVVLVAGWALHGTVYDGYLVPRVLREVLGTLAVRGTMDFEGVAQSDRRVPGAGEGLAGMLDIGVSV
jgi:uncharacterized membrane protein YjgN (DUF898 family)